MRFLESIFTRVFCHQFYFSSTNNNTLKLFNTQPKYHPLGRTALCCDELVPCRVENQGLLSAIIHDNFQLCIFVFFLARKICLCPPQYYLAKIVADCVRFRLKICSTLNSQLTPAIKSGCFCKKKYIIVSANNIQVFMIFGKEMQDYYKKDLVENFYLYIENKYLEFRQ